ncbi:MAG: endonuclease V, partial [Planctomycetota bacterium]
TRKGVKPVFVSVGHRVTLDDAVKMVMACVTRYRLPEPTRLAHNLVTRHRREVPITKGR